MRTPEQDDYVYVRESTVLERLIQRIKDGDRVSLDIEADSLHSYSEKVCLIQLSVGSDHFIVDPLSDIYFTELVQTLAEKPLILHGGDYDLRMLRAWRGFKARSEVFDTMIAARLLGIEQIGLAALVERFLGIAMTKDSQKSDWSRRPLSEKQLRYAINDTRHLEVLAERLHRELLQRGRVEWHRESCCAMVDATGRDRPRDAQQAWRIKGAGRLTPRQLAYLREIWSWRDERARRADRPTFKVLGNRQLLELVQWVESNPDEPLDQGPKLPRDIVGSRRRALKDALDRAASLTSAEWPKRESAPRVHAPPIDQRQFDVLRSDCSKIAEGLAIAPSTLAPKATLEAIVQKQPRTRDEVMACGGLLRWQAELVWPALERTLDKGSNTLPLEGVRGPSSSTR